MLRNVKIGTKILVIMLATSLGALLLISVISYVEMLKITRYSESANVELGSTSSSESEEALLAQAEEYLKKLVAEKAESNDKILRQVSAELSASKNYLEKVYADPDNFVGFIPKLPNETTDGVASDKGFLTQKETMTPKIEEELKLISNAMYGFSSIRENDANLDTIYLGTKSGISYRYSASNSFDPTYDPRERIWYVAAMENPGKPVWIDTYIDNYGTICVTCCSTFNDGTGNIAGVVATDITLQSLQENILSTKVGNDGYAFLLDKDKTYLAHPEFTKEGFEKDPSIGAFEDFKEVLENMASGKTGVERATVEGVDCYVAYATLSETGWSLGITVPIKEVTEAATLTSEKIAGYSETSRLYIEKTLSSVLMRFIVLFAICAILFVLFAFVLSGSITKPISKLALSVKKMGQGDLDAKIEVKGSDEVAQLATAFNQMSDDLKNYINDLTHVTAEKERIGAELNVATKIQADMLPSIFPAFPGRSDMDIFASMTPAKEVGGDFYDFFFIDDHRICLVIGDVSGKGVPAALFMVISKSLIKTRALAGESPKDILTDVNNQLCENNTSQMFVTIWLGIMDLLTGDIVAANAGHEYPAIKRKDGQYELIKDKHDFVIGGMENIPYNEYTFKLEKGDKLFVYTDGVAEATDAHNELYGTDRMLEALNREASSPIKETIEALHKDIDNFAKDVDQFDDITMLGIEYKG